MIQTHPNADKKLTIVLPHTNKALAEVLQEIPKEQFQQLSGKRSLDAIIKAIFQDSLSNNADNEALLKLLQNNPTLKNLTDIQTGMKALLKLLPNNTQLTTALESFTQSIQHINATNLQTKLHNSGIFLESKLAHDDTLQKDFKALLLHASQEITNTHLPNKLELLQHIDKLLLQLDYFQLSSHLAHAQTLFIPYAWDALQEGTLSFKQQKNNHTLCDIDLTLTHYGRLKIRLGLFEQNRLYIQIDADSKELQKLMQDNIATLKEQLLHIGITPHSITFIQKRDNTQPYQENTQDIGCGFEVHI